MRALREARETGEESQARLKTVGGQLTAQKTYSAKVEEEMRHKQELLAACGAKEQSLQDQ
ncbi:hypothetical protein T484DRAFT_1813967, partial [Baffinella frigidus]